MLQNRYVVVNINSKAIVLLYLLQKNERQNRKEGVLLKRKWM
ncbi:MAG: hypothetical protein UZ09_BCD002002049 [Bacteroidetes bacterium OLB9]|nr:MAG: hypothetical protein UZ09_BCD002002049 [Bacteroidetes bacterium OLB9]